MEEARNVNPQLEPRMTTINTTMHQISEMITESDYTP